MRKIFGILLFSLLLLASCGTKQSQPEVTDEPVVDTMSIEEPVDSLYQAAPEEEDTVAAEEEIAL